MFKHYFEQVHNVELWPIISLSIFFIFFIGLILYIIKMDKNYVDEMSNLPIDQTESDSTKTYESNV